MYLRVKYDVLCVTLHLIIINRNQMTLIGNNGWVSLLNDEYTALIIFRTKRRINETLCNGEYFRVADKTKNYRSELLGAHFNRFGTHSVKFKNIINSCIYGILIFSVFNPAHEVTIYKTKTPNLFKEAQAVLG